MLHHATVASETFRQEEERVWLMIANAARVIAPEPISLCVSEFEGIDDGYRLSCKEADNPGIKLRELMGHSVVVGATGMMCGAVPAKMVDCIYRVDNILIPRGLVDETVLIVRNTHRKVHRP